MQYYQFKALIFQLLKSEPEHAEAFVREMVGLTFKTFEEALRPIVAKAGKDLQGALQTEVQKYTTALSRREAAVKAKERELHERMIQEAIGRAAGRPVGKG